MGESEKIEWVGEGQATQGRQRETEREANAWDSQ